MARLPAAPGGKRAAAPQRPAASQYTIEELERFAEQKQMQAVDSAIEAETRAVARRRSDDERRNEAAARQWLLSRLLGGGRAQEAGR